MVRTLFLVAGLQLFGSMVVANDDVTKLLDKLVEVTEPGFGYSGYFSGSEFLPYADTEQMGTLVLGATRRSRSEALREIVAKGAEAVPTLLKHMSDDRKIKMKPLSGMMWMDFSDEYDFNRQTRKKVPESVNRDDFGEGVKHPDSHAITVGDLCFVALGQIANRRFSATRYQPTGGLIVNSPTYSKRLRNVILDDWNEFTVEKHKKLLVEDFKQPDYEDRRTGAYLRLAFYYPNTVEPLVLEELEKPTFDVFKIVELCRERLYKTDDPSKRKQLYDQFIQEHGDTFTVGIEDQLFGDLDTLEAHEEGRLSPRLTSFGTQPRELLIQLFSKPADVKSTDRPHVESASESERARFIKTLTHDKSKKVGDVVRQIFETNSEDDYLAPACLLCLANRGYDSFLVKQLEKIEITNVKTNYLHLQYLESISKSKDEAVQKKLLQILQTTKNDQYLVTALSGLGDVDDAILLPVVTKLIDGLPDETKQGEGSLQLIAERSPESAEDVFKRFLESGNPDRAETMCRVLWYGKPLAKVVLAPLLDDKRALKGFTSPMRVCDRAAQAISHTTKKIKFDSDWSRATKDSAIEKLKTYCEESTK